MKTYSFRPIGLLTILFIAFAGCQKFDKLMPETQVKSISVSQADLVKAFSGLTENNSSACNLIIDNKTIPDVLCKIVSEARAGSEIIFAVDKTGSMADDIDEVKKNINKIIVMGDAPPKTGTGTDHTLEEVLAKAKSLCAGTKFYPVIVL